MKKNLLFGIALLVNMICFTGCPNPNGGNGDGTKTVTVKNADALFVTNTSENNQGYDEQWININVTSNNRSTYNPKENSATLITDDVLFGDGKKKFNINQQLEFKKDIVSGGSQKGTLRYEGKHCYLWTLDNEQKSGKNKYVFTKEELAEIAQKIDTIYEKETALCGPTLQEKKDGFIQPNEKLSILFLDIISSNIATDYIGFFYSDSYNNTNNNCEKMEIIYIDGPYAKENPEMWYSTFSHEFNHLLNYCNKVVKYGYKMDKWYTEMLSMLVEDFFKEDLGLDYSYSVHKRLETFVSGSYTYGFGRFWSNEDSNVNLCYANAYAFGAYLARNFGGAELIHEIATNEYSNEESVVAAVNKINNTSYSFDDLFMNFTKILINPKNEISTLPSLNKPVESKLKFENGNEYTYKLNAIDISQLNENIKIKPNDLSLLNMTKLNSYGFMFFQFDEKTDVKLQFKDFLDYDSYSF